MSILGTSVCQKAAVVVELKSGSEVEARPGQTDGRPRQGCRRCAGPSRRGLAVPELLLAVPDGHMLADGARILTD
jgi:hypothetical protein